MTLAAPSLATTKQFVCPPLTTALIPVTARDLIITDKTVTSVSMLYSIISAFISVLLTPGADFPKGLKLSPFIGLKSKTLVLARSGT